MLCVVLAAAPSDSKWSETKNITRSGLANNYYILTMYRPMMYGHGILQKLFKVMRTQMDVNTPYMRVG